MTTPSENSLEEFGEESSMHSDVSLLESTDASSDFLKSTSEYKTEDKDSESISVDDNSSIHTSETDHLTTDTDVYQSEEFSTSTEIHNPGHQHEQNKSKGKTIVSILIIVLLLSIILMATVAVIIIVGAIRWNKSYEGKESFYFLECSLNDTRLCDSGKFKVLNDDMRRGFVSYDKKKDEFLIVFTDRNEYRRLYSELEDYLRDIEPNRASASNFGGSSGYYDQGGGSSASFNNMEYVGSGYDVYTGNPVFTAGVDNGFRMSIFDSNYGGTMDAKNSLSCDLDFDVYIITSDSKLRDTTHNVVSINYSQKKSSGRGESEATEGKSLLNLPTFSLHHDNLKTVMKLTNKNRVYALSSTECEIYRMNLIKFDHPPPSPTFMNALDYLEDLPWDQLVDEEKEVYVDFVQAFGTHVVTQAHMGAKFSYEFEMNKYLFQKEDTHNVQNTLKLLGIEATLIDNKKLEDTLDDMIVNMRLLSIGARPVYNIDRSNSPADRERDKVEVWAGNAEINPLPIHYQVSPISDYYYYEFGMKKKLIEGTYRADNIEQGIREFYFRSKKQMERHPQQLEVCEMDDGKALQFGEFSCFGSPSESRLEWWAARQKCQLWGGDLVVVDDMLKNYFVSENFVSDSSWIGYYYVNGAVPNKRNSNDEDDDDDDDTDVSSRVMKWVNGEPRGFENFHAKQPDGGKDKDNKDEFCIQTNYERSSMWADSNCRSRLEYVCERPLYSSSMADYNDADSSSTSSGGKDCRDGQVFNNICYRHFRSGVDWGSAKFECARWVPVSWGGRLAIVNTPEISNFLKDEVLSLNREEDWSDFSSDYKKLYAIVMGEENPDLRSMKMRKYVWIGLTDISEEGMWKWEDGVYLQDWRNWDIGRNMKKSKSYDCAAMSKGDGLWVDGDCFQMKHEFVCQYKM